MKDSIKLVILVSFRTIDLSCKRGRPTGSEPELDRWSLIPGDVLALIHAKIIANVDHVSFIATCRSWYSLAADFDKSRFGPLYMSGTGSGSNPRQVMLHDLASSTSLALNLSETAGNQCWGSPFGWIITFEPSNLRFSLVNPFTRATIALPSLPKARARALSGPEVRAFLTANPETDPEDSLVVIVSRYRKLAFAKPARHNKVWSCILGDSHLSHLSYLAHSGGNLYGLQTQPRLKVIQLFLFELNQTPPRAVPTLTLDPGPHSDLLTGSQMRLADLNGELCLCARYYSDSFSPSSAPTTTDFKIFKIDLSTGGLTQILTLGDRCLFIGHSGSFSCEARYLPRNLFERLEDESRREYVSNYVFYTSYYPWFSTYVHCSFDFEVWDIVHFKKVNSTKDPSPTPSYGPLWILP